MPSRNRQHDSSPPDLQDTGFTIHFKESGANANADKELATAAKHGFVPLTKQELLDLQRKIRKDKEKDAMTVEYHGMHFRFNRDHQPSAYEAPYDSFQYEQQQEVVPYGHDHYLHQHPLLYEMSYIIPLVIGGILSICLITVLYFTSLFVAYKWSKSAVRKRTGNDKYEFKGIPYIDPEDETSDQSDV